MRQSLGITNASFGVDDDQEMFSFSKHARSGPASESFLKLMNESTGVDDMSDDDSLADHGGLIQREDDLDDEIAEDYRRYGKFMDVMEKRKEKGKDYREEDFVGYDTGSDEVDSDAEYSKDGIIHESTEEEEEEEEEEEKK